MEIQRTGVAAGTPPAGHACQNLYLAAEQIGCGTCAIGAFDDQQIAE